MKVSKIALMGFSSFFALTGVHAQSAEKTTAYMNTKTFASSVRHLAAWEELISKGGYIADEKSTHSRAVKDFQYRFKNVDNAQWFFDEKVGFISYFKQNGYGNRVIYDKKGRWLYSLILYNEDKLPKDVRTQIKSVYFDSAITLVEEVQTHGATDYVVWLTDKTTISIVRLDSNGDLQTLQEITKG